MEQSARFPVDLIPFRAFVLVQSQEHRASCSVSVQMDTGISQTLLVTCVLAADLRQGVQHLLAGQVRDLLDLAEDPTRLRVPPIVGIGVPDHMSAGLELPHLGDTIPVDQGKSVLCVRDEEVEGVVRAFGQLLELPDRLPGTRAAESIQNQETA